MINMPTVRAQIAPSEDFEEIRKEAGPQRIADLRDALVFVMNSLLRK